MNNDDFKLIRQRLGWSRAEMARRLGADLDVIDAWEAGSREPDAKALNQYHVYRAGADDRADQTRGAPAAEARLESEGLAQITRRELLNER